MSLTTIVLLILMLAAVVFIVRLTRGDSTAGSEAKPRPANRSDTKYHAVSIRFDRNACKAAQDLAGRRFLAAEAPDLPLAACDAAACNCRFVHHADRRSGKDRRSPFAASGRAGTTGEFPHEQRAGNDRRRNDR